MDVKVVDPLIMCNIMMYLHWPGINPLQVHISNLNKEQLLTAFTLVSLAQHEEKLQNPAAGDDLL